MSGTQFTIAELPGVTFTATYDAEKSWLDIEGVKDDGNQHVAAGVRVEATQ